MPNTRSFHFSGDLGAMLVGANGIVVGDFFSGHFAFNPLQTPTTTTPTSATYPLLSFAVGVPYARLAPLNLSIEISTDPQDPSIKVYGESPFGLHVGVLFRGPSGVLANTALPASIKLQKFLIENFTISDVKGALFGYDQTGTPPPGAKVFLRGKLACINVATGIPTV
jgi:hypothetical protein